MKWVRLPVYCKMSGEPEETVKKRRESGEWVDGKHTMSRNRRLWVNLEAADKWVETGL